MLNDIKVKNLKPQEKRYKITDSDGLFIFVHPNGGKYWRLKYRFLGKQKELALGVYPRVSLLEAREKRDQAKKLVSNGSDPSELKKRLKHNTQGLYANSFEIIAREWLT